MCLLIVRFGIDVDSAVVLGANRDERLERPSDPLVVLSDEPWRTLGGRDLASGGTWFSVNRAGVFAGLTNRPTSEGRDPSKRTRGELPLLITGAPSLERGLAKMSASIDPGDFNPCWLLAGDRQQLYSVDLTGTDLLIEELGPGLHVLENKALGEASAKVDFVRSRQDELDGRPWEHQQRALGSILADHTPHPDETSSVRPLEVSACCVHTELYGTRSSLMLRLDLDAQAAPDLHVAPGAPCTHAFDDKGEYW